MRSKVRGFCPQQSAEAVFHVSAITQLSPYYHDRGRKVVGYFENRTARQAGYYPAQGLGCHSPRAARRIPVLFFHPQKVALIESMNPQWQDLSEA
jgi:hypothetical protein